MKIWRRSSLLSERLLQPNSGEGTSGSFLSQDDDGHVADPTAQDEVDPRNANEDLLPFVQEDGTVDPRFEWEITMMMQNEDYLNYVLSEDFFPDSNLFSLFADSDFDSDDNHSEKNSPLHSTNDRDQDRSTFEDQRLIGRPLTSTTVKVSPESEDKLFEHSFRSPSDSSSSEFSDSEFAPTPTRSSTESSDLSSSRKRPNLSKRSCRKQSRLVEEAETKREERLRKRREARRRRLARMTPEELARLREMKRGYNRAAKLKKIKKKESELQIKRQQKKNKKTPKRLPPTQKPTEKLDKKQQLQVVERDRKRKLLAQMTEEEFEKSRATQRDKKRRRLDRMSEEEREKYRESIRQYDREYKKKRKMMASTSKNASPSRLSKKSKIPPQKNKSRKQPQNGATSKSKKNNKKKQTEASRQASEDQVEAKRSHNQSPDSREYRRKLRDPSKRRAVVIYSDSEDC